MAINKNIETKKVRTRTDKISSSVTKVIGSMPFLILNASFFVFWIVLNSGVFGQNLIVDKFPFSFLTTTVSIEAILLSIFVLMSQRREAKLSEARAELDYHSDLKSEVEVRTIIEILQRISEQQGIDIKDLLSTMKSKEDKTINDAVREKANS